MTPNQYPLVAVSKQVSFGVHSLSRPVPYYKTGVSLGCVYCIMQHAMFCCLYYYTIGVRVCVLHNAAILHPYFIIVD